MAGDMEVVAPCSKRSGRRIARAGPILYRQCRRRGGPGAGHPDTGDAGLARPRAAGDLRRWVYRTSRNRCIDHFRRRRFETSLPALDERSHPLWAADLRPPDESVQAGEARARLRQALETLPPAWRQAIVLRDSRGAVLRGSRRAPLPAAGHCEISDQPRALAPCDGAPLTERRAQNNERRAGTTCSEPRNCDRRTRSSELALVARPELVARGSSFRVVARR